MREQDIRIRIIAERVTQAAEQGLRELIGLEDQLRAKTDEAGNAAKAASNKANSATQSEIGTIQKLRNELEFLRKKRDAANDPRAIKVYNEHISTTNGLLNQLEGNTQRSTGMFGSLTQAIGAAFAVERIYAFGESLLSNENRLEASRLALSNVIGSQEEYEKSLTFLSNTAKTYGQDLLVLTDSYKNFIASSNSSNLSLQERSRIFESVIKAGSALKLNNEQLEGSLLAISQMFSKGNVSAEELRGQLGERLPGAFGIMAKALGVSEKQLNKMLEQGQVLAADALPKFATELEKAFGDKATANINTMGGSFNLLKNKVTESFDKFNQGVGITDGLAKSFRVLADNFEPIVKIGGTAIGVFVAYEVVTRAVALASAGYNLVQKAGLIIKGEAILATQAYTGITIAETQAQIAATASARSFNKALANNPLAIVMIALGALATAYMVYSENVDAAKERQTELSKKIAEGLAPLERSRLKFNELANEVLNGSVSYERQLDILNDLKKEHPELLKGVTDLSEAERILNEKGIKTNSTLDYRTQKFNELKEKYPVQLTGINNLEEAERKLSGVIRLTNADFANRARLLENEVRINYNNEQATNAIKEKILLENQLRNASTNSTTLVVGTAGRVERFDSEAEKIRKLIKVKDELVLRTQQANEKLANSSESITKKLNFDYDEQSKAAIVSNNKSTESTKKRVKEVIDSEKTLALIKQKASYEALEKTRESELKIVDLEAKIAEQRITESKNSAKKKAVEIEKIEIKHKVEISEINRKYDEKETKELEKLLAERKKFSKDFNEALLDLEVLKRKSLVKEKQKENAETKKLDEEYTKDLVDEVESRYDKEQKLRLLRRVSYAKDEREITEIFQQEERLRLLEKQANAQKELLNGKQRLELLKNIYGEESVEYKKARNELLKVQTEFNKASGDLLENNTDKVIEEIEKQARVSREVLSVVASVIDKLFDETAKKLDAKIEATDSKRRKMLFEAMKAEGEIAQSATNAVVSLISGDVKGAVTSAIDAVYKALNAKSEKEQRLIEFEATLRTEQIEAQIALIEGRVGKITGLSSDIAKIYSAFIKTKESIVENEYASGVSLLELFEKIGVSAKEILNTGVEQRKSSSSMSAELIAAEVKRGEAVQNYYTLAVAKENELLNANLSRIDEVSEKEKTEAQRIYSDAIGKINDLYDEEIRRINQKYDLIAAKQGEQYDAETLAILENQSQQLLGLITNEESKTSIVSEFAAKRGAIEKQFAVAYTEITAGMTQDEIDAIYAARTARDAALTELQKWYTTELEYVVGSEGQKRKEYSETDKIRQEAEWALDRLRDENTLKEIQRNSDKNAELKAASDEKDQKTLEAAQALSERLNLIEKNRLGEIEAATSAHNDRILQLTKDRDKAMAESYENLKNLMLQYMGEIQTALNNLGPGNTEKFNELLGLLEQIKNAYKEISGLDVPQTETTRGGSTGGSDGARTPTTTRRPRFAQGTERVLGYGYPDGIDTVPAYVNKGERIISAGENNLLRNIMGKDMSNADFVKMAEVMKNLTDGNDTLTMLRRTAAGMVPISFKDSDFGRVSASEQLLNLNLQNLEKKFDKVEKGILSLNQIVKKLPIENFTFDEKGFSRAVTIGNTTMNYMVGKHRK